MIYSPDRSTSSRPDQSWTVIIQEINEQTRRQERTLSICLEIAVLTLAALAVWAVVVAVMEMTL